MVPSIAGTAGFHCLERVPINGTRDNESGRSGADFTGAIDSAHSRRVWSHKYKESNHENGMTGAAYEGFLGILSGIHAIGVSDAFSCWKPSQSHAITLDFWMYLLQTNVPISGCKSNRTWVLALKSYIGKCTPEKYVSWTQLLGSISVRGHQHLESIFILPRVAQCTVHHCTFTSPLWLFSGR